MTPEECRQGPQSGHGAHVWRVRGIWTPVLAAGGLYGRGGLMPPRGSGPPLCRIAELELSHSEHGLHVTWQRGAQRRETRQWPVSHPGDSSELWRAMRRNGRLREKATGKGSTPSRGPRTPCGAIQPLAFLGPSPLRGPGAWKEARRPGLGAPGRGGAAPGQWV